MRKIKYSTVDLKKLFYKKKIITMKDIMNLYGVNNKKTVFRKLNQFNYCSSYSHAGKYYSLNEIAHYNKFGIWEINNILFSIKGTLLNTLHNLIEISEIGYTAHELIEIVKIRVQDALYKLYKSKKICRREINSIYIYFSNNKFNEQLKKRKKSITEKETQQKIKINYSVTEYENYLNKILSTLNEKQRRLYVGFESIKIGYGGDKRISEITGIDAKTIAAGRKELLNNDINTERIRKEGAGRQSIKKKQKSNLNLIN